jgi:hypothetical protein
MCIVHGRQALLYEATGDQKYADKLTEGVNWLLNEAQVTPGGMLYLGQWGSCRNAANAALQLLIVSIRTIHNSFTPGPMW